MWLELVNSAGAAQLLAATLMRPASAPPVSLTARLREHRVLLALLAAVNVAHYLASQTSSHLAASLANALATRPALVGMTAAAAGSVLLYFLAAILRRATSWSSAATAGAGVLAAAAGLLAAVLLVAPLPLNASVRRILLASLGFTVLGVVDARLRRPELPARALLQCVLRASLGTLLLIIPLAVAVAFVVFLLTLVADGVLHLSHDLLNAPIEWAVLYLPWMLQYFLVQRACLRVDAAVELSTSRPRGSTGGGGGGVLPR